MVDFDKWYAWVFSHPLLSVFLVSIAPLIGLVLRGVVWGSDSFAFLAYSCGNYALGARLSSSVFFLDFLRFLNCDNTLIFGFMWLFYFLGLVGVWLLGNYVFKNRGVLLPIYVGSITPLFFIEGLRFENDLFAWTVAFLGLGLFTLYLTSNKVSTKAILLILISCCFFFSVFTWLASILIWFICLLLLVRSNALRKSIILVFIAGFIIIFHKYIIQSFTSLVFSPSLIAEEIPFVGIIFILHIIHYWNKTPEPFHYYSIILLLIGLIKSKYLYLATPFLLMGLIQKELTIGLKTRKGKTIQVLPLAVLLLIGWTLTSTHLYPTQTDLEEIKETIQYAQDNNLKIYNSWGDGWIFEYLSYPTKYKSSIPEPDWNNLPKPYIAWSKEKINGCNSIKNLSLKTQLCNP